MSSVSCVPHLYDLYLPVQPLKTENSVRVVTTLYVVTILSPGPVQCLALTRYSIIFQRIINHSSHDKHSKIPYISYLESRCNPNAFCSIWRFSSVQSLSRVPLLQPHEPQHIRPSCPSPTPRVYPNPCPSSQ